MLRGRGPQSGKGHVDGSWNLYDHRAAGHDLSRPDEVPTDYWVLGEGEARDVPPWDGVRTVLLGPPSYPRSWNNQRLFDALAADLLVIEELSHDDVSALLARAAGGS